MTAFRNLTRLQELDDVDHTTPPALRNAPLWDGTKFVFGAVVESNDPRVNVQVNVKSFGAKGDGVTNDSTAIQAAIASITSGEVIFPAGTYKLNTTITLANYIRLVGVGSAEPRATTLAPAAGINAITIPHNCTGFAIEKLKITGGAIGIKGNGEASLFTFRDLFIVSTTSHGIETDVAEHFSIKNIKIQATGGDSIHFGQVVASNGRTERGSLETVRIDTPIGNGIFIDGQSGFGSSLQIRNSSVIAAGQNALKLNATRESVISTFNVENAGVVAGDNTVDAIRIYGSAARLMFDSCNAGFSGISANAQRYAYSVGGSASTFRDCTGAARTAVWNPIAGDAAYFSCAGTGLPSSGTGTVNTVIPTQLIVGFPNMGAGAGCYLIAGDGSPLNVVSAPKGSIYMRTDGGANTSIYIKESGAGNTGWVAK